MCNDLRLSPDQLEFQVLCSAFHHLKVLEGLSNPATKSANIQIENNELRGKLFDGWQSKTTVDLGDLPAVHPQIYISDISIYKCNTNNTVGRSIADIYDRGAYIFTKA